MPQLSNDALRQLFFDARSHNAWLDQAVSDESLRELHHLTRWAPTSANCSPLRVVFVRSAEAKERLIRCVMPSNAEKTRNAPVTAILGQDLEFHEKLPKLFPHADAKTWFAGNAALIESTAFRNSSMQGGYFILAARALGLDCGPMSGFDVEAVNREFFAGTSHRANFLCNLGYGDPSKLFPRSPRFEFDEVCTIV
ncbi:MAG: malonic semialdehyde reductase [Phycisphaerales bacterium]|nr:malonic semialdehyde reductase [Phycisphaerales bacterium]